MVLEEEVCPKNGLSDIGDVELLREQLLAKLKWDCTRAPRLNGGTISGNKRGSLWTGISVNAGSGENGHVSTGVDEVGAACAAVPHC